MDIKKTIKNLLPGIFLIGFCIGTGSVTAMAKAGANYGMALLWAVLISCLITFFLINLYGRYAIITGETALNSFRKHIHPAAGIFLIVALGIHIGGSIMGVMGIIADICHEWSKMYIEGGIHAAFFALFFITAVYAVFLGGRMEFFQKALAAIVAVMALSFIVNAFILAPPPLEVLKGLIPNIPPGATESDKGPLLVIASMVGTTVFSGLFLVRTTLVRDAGWTMDDLAIQRRDAAFSGTLMFIISAVIMASAAGTLFVKGMSLDKPAEMIELLKPFAGGAAIAVFATGIVAAGVSSQFPNVMLIPWLIDDYSGKKRDMTDIRYRLAVAGLSLLGLVVPIFHARPVAVMIASQAFGSLHLPVTVACIFYLGNKKSVMGEGNTFSMPTNAVLAAIQLLTLFFSYTGILGLIDMVQKHI